MPDAASELPRKRQPLTARNVLFLLAVAIGAAYLCAPTFWLPWGHYTGGSFHLVPWWAGAGSFDAPDGTYQLYLSISPMDTGSHPTLRTPLVGDGHLCTPSGERLILHIEGDMDKHLPVNTLGRSVDISSYHPNKPGTFSELIAAGSPYVKLTGVWGPGRIDANGTLEYQPPAPGHPAPPKPAPISVTLRQAGTWWPPPCPAHGLKR